MKKIVGFALAIALLSACKKDTESTDNNGSKLKRVIQSVAGTKETYITAVEYDAQGRVSKFNEWSEDTIGTRAVINSAYYCSFVYNGNSESPRKCIVTDEGGVVDSTIYSYNSAGQLIQEDFYRIGVIENRRTYGSITSTLVRSVLSIPTGGSFLGIQNDSLRYDINGRLTEVKMYNVSNNLLAKDTYAYDNANSPFAGLNVFKFVHHLYSDDRKSYYRSANNITQYKNDAMGNSTTLNFTYSYNTANFPAKANASIMVSGSPFTINSNLIFEYY